MSTWWSWPVPPPAAATDDDVRAAVAAARAKGATTRDAVSEVAGVLGLSKRRVYELAVRD